MNDVSFAFWALVVMFHGFFCLSAYELGTLIGQTVLRVKGRHRRHSYQKWGVITDLFRPISTFWFAVAGVFFLLATVFMGLLAFGSTALLMEEPSLTRDNFYQSMSIGFYALFIGFVVESERIAKITEKARKLDELRDVFRARFKVSDLLSTYDSLRTAPPLFWDEYAGLTDDEINENTNRDYRERAAPYNNIQFGRYSRIIIVVAILTLVMAGVTAAIQFYV